MIWLTSSGGFLWPARMSAVAQTFRGDQWRGKLSHRTRSSLLMPDSWQPHVSLDDRGQSAPRRVWAVAARRNSSFAPRWPCNRPAEHRPGAIGNVRDQAFGVQIELFLHSARRGRGRSCLGLPNASRGLDFHGHAVIRVDQVTVGLAKGRRALTRRRPLAARIRMRGELGLAGGTERGLVQRVGYSRMARGASAGSIVDASHSSSGVEFCLFPSASIGLASVAIRCPGFPRCSARPSAIVARINGATWLVLG